MSPAVGGAEKRFESDLKTVARPKRSIQINANSLTEIVYEELLL